MGTALYTCLPDSMAWMHCGAWSQGWVMITSASRSARQISSSDPYASRS